MTQGKIPKAYCVLAEEQNTSDMHCSRGKTKKVKKGQEISLEARKEVRDLNSGGQGLLMCIQ